MARQAALLILTVHGIEKPEGPASNDFYRQALELDLRDKREFTTAVLSAMGGISKVHFRHFKALLQLSDEAMELADRHNIDEKKLRYVAPLPPENHAEVVRQIISFNLTSAQVKQLCEQDVNDEPSTPELAPISKSALQVAKLARGGGEAFAQDLARALLVQEHDVAIARARLVAIRKLIDDAERYLEASE